MFGRRTNEQGAQPRRIAPQQQQPAPAPATPAQPRAQEAPAPAVAAARAVEAAETQRRHSEEYYDVKTTVFNALIDTIDLTQLAKLDAAAAREEIRDIVSEIIQVKNVVMSIAEQEELLEDICNDVLGYGPLEPLLARDDIADIMVNGAATTFIEVSGKVQKTSVRFADNQQLMNICQRIVSQVGRRVDESSPICDARLPDGSRVNVIAPPLAIDGPALTIRKFKKDRLRLDNLVKFGSITPAGKTVLEIIGRVRCNVLISGGTGSGKTTLLNCLTGCIDHDERIITCEDSAELQLQQPHVVRLETRPPNLEGEGEITMRDLVKNCLRMRPERIIVGEVRGPEAFDLLQAMNTGHDGSMGTLHANSPREAISRLESMIMMGGYALPVKTIREMICGSIDVIVQASRLRDGSRKITHITEVLGMEEETVTLQNILVYEVTGEDANGKLVGRHRSTGIARPRFWDRAEYYKEEGRLAAALAASEVLDSNGNPLGESHG
jgi:pilus assembly protein CpaF